MYLQQSQSVLDAAPFLSFCFTKTLQDNPHDFRLSQFKNSEPSESLTGTLILLVTDCPKIPEQSSKINSQQPVRYISAHYTYVPATIPACPGCCSVSSAS